MRFKIPAPDGVTAVGTRWVARHDRHAAAAAAARVDSSAPRRFPAAERGRLAPVGIDVGLTAEDFDDRSLSITDHTMAELRVLLGSCKVVMGQAALAVGYVQSGYAVRGSFNQGDVVDTLSRLIIEGREMRATVDNVYNLVSMLQRHLSSRHHASGGTTGTGDKKR